MPLQALKIISQDTWLSTGLGPERYGVCYYMCNYIESDHGPWNKPGSFAQAVKRAQEFGLGHAMMNYAKAQMTRHARQISAYTVVTGPLVTNRIYRAGLWVGATEAAPGAPNHEIIIVTGNDDEIVYFEPNFGFFMASKSGSDNRQALEHCINDQYAAKGMHAKNFEYYNVRTSAAAEPKGFNP